MQMHFRNIRHYIKFDFNEVIKILTISDIFIISGFGLVAPIFAVYVTDNISGGSLQAAGVASMIYLLARSLGQIPVAHILDKIVGERDDFKALFYGTLVTSFVPLLYIFVDSVWQLYLVQLIYGISASFIAPSWLAMFTRHVDKNHEGMEWSIYSMTTDLGAAAVAGLGGIIAYSYGFRPLFVMVFLMSITGTLFLLMMRKSLNIKKV